MPDPDHSEIATELDAEGIPDLDDSDATIEGTMAPRDHPIGALDFGTTQAEERKGETLGDRVLREEPELKPGDEDQTEVLESLGNAAPDQVDLDEDHEVDRLLDADSRRD